MTPSGAAFELVGEDELGVVLIHGFTGSPFEVRYLGEQLARAGMTVSAPLLPGHGTSLDDLDRTSWRQWVDHVDAAATALAARCTRVAIVGQSLGGLLSLYVASRRKALVSVASLAAPVWLEGLSARVASWAQRGLVPLRSIPKFGGSDVRDRRVRAAFSSGPCYPAIPMRALGELMAFMRVADEALPRVTQPVLVLHARHDHTAPVACAPYIAERTRARRIRILPRSYHLIAADVERDIVAAEVIGFLRQGESACAT